MINALKDRLRSVSIVPPWTRFLPGDSQAFGPPRRWARAKDYAQTFRCDYREIEPAEVISEPALTQFGPVDRAFASPGTITIPPRAVFRDRNVSILGPDAHLVGREDTFLWDAAWHGGSEALASFRDRSISRRKRALPRRRLAGLTAALGSDWAMGSFGHFVHDALPRWRLLQKAGYTAADFAHFVIYHPNSVASRWFLVAAGIPIDRIVSHDPRSDLICDELVGTTLLSYPPAHSTHTMAWLRKVAGSDAANGHKLVYLSRAGYRRHPANANELESEFARFGFLTKRGDDGMAANQACLDARIIVGVEGTNLASACFAPPGARIVLLLPGPNMFPVYPFMFAACGHHTAVVPADAGSPIERPTFALAAVRTALEWAARSP